ncbi:MAG TPA: DUF853 domain-containing protein [Lachnospiraceae bacterium]|nr:DUF853 domain-containing protein [Lachnospiraceae bacterium]
MVSEGKIIIGKSEEGFVSIIPKMANRHGLIAGATGTGKTVTLKVLAESFSDMGVPVFLADAKGDLAGCINEGAENENVNKRIEALGLDETGFSFAKYPVTFWDVYGEGGIPLRTTISEMGPLLLSRILDLNDTQSDLLTVAFKIADDENLLLTDTKDLKSMLSYMGDHASEYSMKYGNITKQSLAAIIRGVVALESEGGELFFGEPALNIRDMIATDENGKGKLFSLDCRKLMLNPRMYATFLLWMLSELFETLPEVGDLEKPRMIFFFDEAHMLFEDAPKVLLSKVEQVVKLIRSKGVGIYFITQNPSDIPDGVLAQLGNKIQHALHAYTPAESKKVKAAADSFRENPAFSTIDVLEELGTGEALVSVLDEKGVPGIVQRCVILPPRSQMGAISDETRDQAIKADILYIKYFESVDNDSAYEFLLRKGIEEKEEADRIKEEEALTKQKEKEEAAALKQKEREEAAALKAAEREEAAKIRAEEREKAAALKKAEAEQAKKDRAKKSAIKKVGSSAAGTVGREFGKQAGKAIGGKFGKTLGGNVGAALGRGLLDTLFKL